MLLLKLLLFEIVSQALLVEAPGDGDSVFFLVPFAVLSSLGIHLSDFSILLVKPLFLA